MVSFICPLFGQARTDTSDLIGWSSFGAVEAVAFTLGGGKLCECQQIGLRILRKRGISEFTAFALCLTQTNDGILGYDPDPTQQFPFHPRSIYHIIHPWVKKCGWLDSN